MAANAFNPAIGEGILNPGDELLERQQAKAVRTKFHRDGVAGFNTQFVTHGRRDGYSAMRAKFGVKDMKFRSVHTTYYESTNQYIMI